MAIELINRGGPRVVMLQGALGTEWLTHNLGAIMRACACQCLVQYRAYIELTRR